MLTDLFAHKYFDNPKSAEEFTDDDFNLEEELAKLEAEAEQEAEANLSNISDWEDVPTP